MRSVYAARDSELWAGCEAAGVPVREFGGWAAFAEEVLCTNCALRGSVRVVWRLYCTGRSRRGGGHRL